MTIPANQRYRGGRLLDLPADLGQRAETVRFDILNADLTFAFTATHVDRDDPPVIHFDANAETNRTMSGIRIGYEDAQRINPLVHLIQPRWVLHDASEWPMGVFHFADTPLDVRSWGYEFTPECYDRSVILNQERGRTFVVESGGLLIQAARTLLAEVGLLAWSAIENSNIAASAAMMFPPTNTRKQTLNSLCEAMGFYPAYFNNDGFCALRSVPNPISDAAPDVIYTADQDSRILADTVQISSNIQDAPNVYRVIGSPASGGEVVGTFRVPESAPHSVSARGFEVVKTIHNQGVQDALAAEQAAQAAYVNDFSTHVQVAFETAPDPRADGMQVVRFLDTNYREQQWGIECSPGGAMVHIVQEVWQP